jgi:hypothetical protein
MGLTWKPRSEDRVPDAEWISTLNRIRAEFQEMPCLRVTTQQAGSLFGVPPPLSQWVLDRLSREGFLESRNGEYLRRHQQP